MKFAPVAKAKKKAESIVGIFFLMFLSSGCVSYVSDGGQISKCNQAQQAVDRAQKQFDAAIVELASKPKDEATSKSVASTTPNLGTLEEDAYDLCYRVK
jgi:hypothetical protein